MNILAIVADIDSDNLGGAEGHFVEVMSRLLPTIKQATVLVGPDTGIGRVWQKYKNLEIIPVSYPHITNLYGLMFVLFAIPRGIELMRKKKYDVIWAKQEFPQGVVGGFLKIIFRVPMYVTCQSARLHRDELVIVGPIPSQIKSWLSDLASPFIKFAFQQADVVGAVSNFSATQVRKMGGKRVVVVPNGVDRKKYYVETTKKKKEGRLRIVTTSSLIFRNGIDNLIEGCARLPANINWELVIAGDGPIRKELEQLAANLGVRKRIQFLGRINNSEVPKLLRSSDIFVRVSRAEGFGSSFLEAMACGLPVIATPVGGITDFLVDGENGLLVPPDDPQALARAISELAVNKILRNRLQEGALEMVKNKYNWERVANLVYGEMTSLLTDK